MDHIICPFEVKSQPGDDEGIVRGYGSVFNNVDSSGDIVAKGAFKKTLEETKSGAKGWPPFLLQHGDSTSDGRTPIGIWISMDEDERGLKLVGKLALKNTRGAEAYALLKMKPRPALNGLSIGYRCTESEIHKSGPARRTLRAVDLVEVSLVTFPANRLATVTGIKSGEPEPVIVDWEEVARADFEMLSRTMTKGNRSG
jgi:HK97 family phage prohead protease